MQVLLGAATLFFCCCCVAAFGSQDLGFKTQTDRRTQHILRSSHLFPVTFLSVHCHFSFSRPFLYVQWSQTDGRTNATSDNPPVPAIRFFGELDKLTHRTQIRFSGVLCIIYWFLLLFFSLGTATLLLLLLLFFFSYCYYYFSFKTWLAGPGFQDSGRQTHDTRSIILSLSLVVPYSLPCSLDRKILTLTELILLVN
jgi:hypothetical protein